MLTSSEATPPAPACIHHPRLAASRLPTLPTPRPRPLQASAQRAEFAQAAVKDMVDFLFQGEADSIQQLVTPDTPPTTMCARRLPHAAPLPAQGPRPGADPLLPGADPLLPGARCDGRRLHPCRSPLEDGWSESRSPPATITLPMRCVDSGRVAIFDATNSTRKRRAWLREQLGSLPIKLLFIESVCTDEAIVDRNIWNSKVVLPEYSHLSPEQAFQDFRNRIDFYKSVYEEMDEEELSWIKLINCGRRVEINNIHGFLLGRIVQFLSNMHNTPHSIYLTRHGQSEYNRVGKIGGDSPITDAGDRYARLLAEFCLEHVVKNEKGERVRARLWTSSLKRTIQTARYIPHPKLLKDGQEWVQMSPRVLRNLDELYAGVCDGMTYAEIEDNYPEEYKMRKEDKLGYRYPRGESYLDVISRLDPLVHELESYSEPVVIVGHQAVLRLIYAYFTGKPREACPRLSIPLNCIIKLTPRTHDCEEERFMMDINAGGGAWGTGDNFADSVEPPSH